MRNVKTRILIQTWEEEEFTVPLRNREAERLMQMITPWEVEAVGASDDPSRFHVDAELLAEVADGISELRY